MGAGYPQASTRVGSSRGAALARSTRPLQPPRPARRPRKPNRRARTRRSSAITGGAHGLRPRSSSGSRLTIGSAPYGSRSGLRALALRRQSNVGSLLPPRPGGCVSGCLIAQPAFLHATEGLAAWRSAESNGVAEPASWPRWARRSVWATCGRKHPAERIWPWAGWARQAP